MSRLPDENHKGTPEPVVLLKDLIATLYYKIKSECKDTDRNGNQKTNHEKTYDPKMTGDWIKMVELYHKMSPPSDPQSKIWLQIEKIRQEVLSRPKKRLLLPKKKEARDKD